MTSFSLRRVVYFVQIPLFIFALIAPLSFSIENNSFSYLNNVSADEGHPGDVPGHTHSGPAANPSEPPTLTTTNNTAYQSFKSAGAGCSVNPFKNANPIRAGIICYSNFWLFIASEILIISAYVFDILLLIAISSEFLRLDVINELWTSIKDIANLGFILALIWISFSLILGTGMNNVRKLLVRVILIGLLMNFSLFVARVIIDAGNLTASTFYNSIKAPEIKSSRASVIDYLLPKSAENALDNSRKSSISGAVVGAVNPARILGQENFEAIVEEQTGNILAFDFMLAFSMLGVALISVLMAKELIVGGFFFLSRIVWLMLLMVISPLAFVAWFMPGGEKYFKGWFSTIIERAFCLIPYLFALWMVLLVNQAARGDHTAFTASGDSTNIYLIVTLQFAIMYMVMKIARQKSQKMCEGGMGVGNMALKAANAGTGALMGAVTGGAGVVARRGVGRLGYKALEGDGRIGRFLADSATSDSGARRFVGNLGLNASDWAANAKFGTSKGYKKAADDSADREVKRANKISNVVTNVEKGRRKAILDEQIRKANPELNKDQVDERINLALKAEKGALKKKGTDAGKVYLEGRTKGTTGIMASVTAGLNPDAAKEAVGRFSGKEREAAEKLEKQATLSNFANAIGASFAQQSAEVSSSVDVAKDTTKEMIKNGETASAILENTQVKETKQDVEDTIKPTYVDSGGKVTVKDHTTITQDVANKADEQFKKDINNAVTLQKEADAIKSDIGAWKAFTAEMDEKLDDRDAIIDILTKMTEKLDTYDLSVDSEIVSGMKRKIVSGEEIDTVLASHNLYEMNDDFNQTVSGKVASLERAAEMKVDNAYNAMRSIAEKSLNGKSAMSRQMAEAQYRSVSDESARKQETLGDSIATDADVFADDADTGVPTGAG